MKNLNLIASDLFNKVRGRFPSVTIGNENGEVVNKPEEARYFDFDFVESGKTIGRVSISLTEDSVSIMYNNDFITNEDQLTKDSWYDFLREMRTFAKKRLLNFDTRDITKSNLNKRDYKFLSANQFGDITMESKMYGTTKTSFQNIGSARLAIKHNEAIDPTRTRLQKIAGIFIETNEGERFKYPYNHLSGARAMARHVSEGGKFFDDFGKSIVEMSTELSKLKKFKNYLGRSAVMAETLGGYKDVIIDRMKTLKVTLEGIQKPGKYQTYIENFQKIEMKEVPEDVKENWIDQLTIKQFNEELSDVFPYIYNLIGEGTKAKELSPEDLEEGPIDWIKDKYADFQQGREESMAQYEQDLHILRTLLKTHGYDDATIGRVENDCLNDPRVCLYNLVKKNRIEAGDMDMELQRIGDELNSGLTTRVATTDEAIEDAFESMLGQFAENDVKVDERRVKGKPSWGDEIRKKRAADDEDELQGDIDEQKLPVTEFVLSMFDRHTGQFPKGETAVLTAVEKDYGESFITPAKKFIEAVSAKYKEVVEDGGEGYSPQENYMRSLLMNFRKELPAFSDVTDEYMNIMRDASVDFRKALRNIKGHPELGPMFDQWMQQPTTTKEGDSDDLDSFSDYDDDDSLYDPRRDNKGLRRKRNSGGVNTRAPIIDIDDMEFFYDDINEADQQTVAKLRTVQQNIQAGQAANDADAIMAAGSELGSILADEVMPEMYKFLDKFVREFEAACKEHANDPDPKWQQACKQLPRLKAELEQSKRDSMQAGMANIGRQDAGESVELDRIRSLAGVAQ